MASDSEEDRRRKEMNMFAAFALGGANDGSNLDFDFAAAAAASDTDEAEVVTGERDDDDDDDDFLPPQHDRVRDSFLEAARGSVIKDSGSFAFASVSKKQELAEKSNLNAAVAALSRNEGNQNEATAASASHQTSASALNVPNGATAAPAVSQHFRDQENPEDNIPMFAEQVVMPRPLFFGAIVPPRVLETAKEMVQAAAAELNKPDVRLHELPDEVRNLVGALRTYGYGLDKLVLEPLKSTSSVRRASFEEAQPEYRGSPYVSTFQPVWGSDVRAERVKDYQSKRKLSKPPIVSRVTTAPARMVDDTDDDDDDEEYVSTKAPIIIEEEGEEENLDASELSNPQLAEEAEGSFHAGANEQFSMWLKNTDEANNMSTDSMEEDLLSPLAKENTFNDSVLLTTPKPLTEQEKFSQWALGSDSGGFREAASASGNDSTTFNAGTFQMTGASPFNPSTFQRLPSGGGGADSDDDSVIDDELKKKVGVNDHLSKAVALLAEDGQAAAAADTTIEQSQVLLSQVSQDANRKRPLTNYELTCGCVPLFGVDDSPLPQESDLGVHETKEEQQRASEQKRSQEIIEKFVPPNVFGPVACPNPALNPDDFHSWNSRAIAAQRMTPITSGTTIASDPLAFQSRRLHGLTAGSDPTSPRTPTTKPPKHRKKSRHPPRPMASAGKPFDTSGQRFGWWDESQFSESEQSAQPAQDHVDLSPIAGEEKDDDTATTRGLQLPPIHHSASVMQITSPLEPTPEKLREDNLPLSRMDAATSMVQTLPYIGDRPNSFRYLQIDTQAIAFPPVKGEIEPLFCSLAIYNVETISSGISSGGKNSAPVPDMQRCGRITEALHFDHVLDSDIEARCEAALWPYSKSAVGSFEMAIDSSGNEASQRLKGTRCGVFPLPSNLNVANLYAVLIVRKVVSEESDFDPYLKPGKNSIDIAKLKINAEKACHRHGTFLMPFAFGVAPLLQVFGADNPVAAISRAVQIPLFRYSDGERQIIDHIMVMLFPKADHKANGVGGPAPVTNGGTAMLVMRNFGYLGLHTVVDSKSSLARDRLVDFTGELQLRRRADDEKTDSPRRRHNEAASDNYRETLPDWHPKFIAEPTVNGGRNRPDFAGDVSMDRYGSSKLYAQELAPLPLLLTPSSSLTNGAQSARGRGRPSHDDIEPFYHTSFCNELLCQPRILHNCPRGKISIKFELREVEWNNALNAYFAHVPGQNIGPTIHNPRRGPFLVQSAFTCCTPRRSDHQFIDEFKMKLPLDLNSQHLNGSQRVLSLFFTVYRVKLGSSSKWKRGAKMLFGSSIPESLGTSTDVGSSGKTRIDQVACGFLPVSSQSCLLDNGLHDVRIVYKAKTPSQEICEQTGVPPTSLLLVERALPAADGASVTAREDSFAEDTTISNDSQKSDRNITIDTSMRTDSNSDLMSLADDSQSKGTRTKTVTDPISLSVRIVVYSSLHSQNVILNELLSQESDLPRLSYSPNKVFMATLRMGRDYLASNARVGLNSRKFQDREDVMLDPTISLTNHQLCSVPRSTRHLMRIMPILWRSLICGVGEPDLVWSNPAASTSLRVHSFATILHLIGATSLYLSKHGVTQVDGTSKMNVVVLGRVIALMFDEQKLFGLQGVEKFDEAYWSSPEILRQGNSSQSKRSPPARRIRHHRTTYELGNDLPPRLESPRAEPSFLSSAAGDLATPSRKSRGEIMKPMKNSHPYTPALSEVFEIDVRRTADDDEQPPKQDVKVDTKSDFQGFLRAANAISEDDIDKPKNKEDSGAGAKAAKAFVKAYGGVSAGSNRRFMSAPASTPLSTIREGGENGDESGHDLTEEDDDGVIEDMLFPSIIKDSSTDSNEKFESLPNRSGKQMRRPKLKQGGSLNVEVNSWLETTEPKKESARTAPLIITSDDDIETMGTAFLESLGSSLGMTGNPSGNDEEQRVGSSHHRRRTHGRSSIDWSLIGDESASPTPSNSQEEPIRVTDSLDENDDRMSTLRAEESTTIKLPTFVDRLALIGNQPSDTARWFPFAYEVIIMQWAAILTEQRKSGEKHASDRVSGNSTNFSANEKENLGQAASRSVGVAVASAPMLFEVIKQSLGFRVKTLFDEVISKKGSRLTPPLVAFDDTLMMHLVQVVSMVTDACIDSRNFDSWDLRQMSIDVNDAIVRFLRDLFSFLAPSSVHRLILIYLSRFLTKEGKHFTDRDSVIGLRCSWEITKLRLNAVTSLVRFPDFIRVNSPQMLNWSNWWTSSPLRSSGRFFDDILCRYQRFQLPDFVTNEGDMQKDIVPPMRPHWLAEIVTDACLLGTEHAEQYIQHRSASLLYELFWACSQESIFYGISAPVASMFVTFVEKLISNASYLSNFSPKCQLRKDVLSCGVFVMQSTPTDLLRSLWRRLLSRLPGKGLDVKYGVVGDQRTSEVVSDEREEDHSRFDLAAKEEPDILGMFSVLNLSLSTLEYEGSDSNVEGESCEESLELWRKEYLLSRTESGPHPGARRYVEDEQKTDDTDYTSTTSRKWQAHDGSMVIINIGHQIVREMYTMLSKSPSGKSLLNPSVRNNRQSSHHEGSGTAAMQQTCSGWLISKADAVVFIRGATSLYLHALALRESDIVVGKTLSFSAEVIKIFGIQLFLEAVGETLQHWMRVISLHCGARRAQVRIEATDLLELVLRSTWECYGSFFRIRVPLLAVQTEVMERIVATAAARYYKEQRRLGTNFETFTNVGAEASLVPLWRTLDRIQKQPASQNVAFRGALIRIAGKLKKLYRAYVAARVLSFIKNSRDEPVVEEKTEGNRDYEAEAVVRAYRINILRVINQSEGYSKQFLGFQGTTQHRNRVAHFEAVEDALIEAADVFSPTELPEHRVAWLRMLAEFHNSRKKYAEEATCHYYIHVTLHLAARLHGSLWSNTPFLPWTDNIPDPIVYIDGDTTPTADPDYQADLNLDGKDWDYGGQMESANSFRRIFYRVANSIAINNNEWEAGGSKNIFYGITFASEYYTVSPWITLRQMEENMVEEVEAAGSLFLKAGIVESSRFAWSLATQYYAEKFNYARLAIAYGNLARAVVSQVPAIDTSLPQEVSATLGRFYRVWFHGGTTDELSGVEFVYRTQGSVRLKEFGVQLRDVIKSIVPHNTPIHLVLDGLPEERDEASHHGGFRIGPAPLEPVRIKVTPLRPLFEKDSGLRGLPEWFYQYVDEAFSGPHHRSKSTLTPEGIPRRASDPAPNAPASHHVHSRSFSATVFSSAGSSAPNGRTKSGLQSISGTSGLDRRIRFAAPKEGDLSGVDKFCFVQPKDRSRPKEWWKVASGDFAEKSLRVTQLQVAESFPACVARQAVVHRLVYSQSPLEAGIDSVCQWCAVLFRTAVATVGMTVLKTNFDPGIGTDAAKVVADCIHNSHVKEIGLSLLRKHSDLMEGDSTTEFSMDHDNLSEDEIKKLQLKLARLIVTFIELLHLLIARNRDKLLDVIQERKKIGVDGSGSVQGSVNRGYNRTTRDNNGRRNMSIDLSSHRTSNHRRVYTDSSRSDGARSEDDRPRAYHHADGARSEDARPRTYHHTDGARSEDARPRTYHHAHVGSDDNQSYHSMMTNTAVRTDSAIAVQSELQRAFISLTRTLYSNVSGIMQSDTPRWFKQSGQDNYFSLGTYRQTKIPIAEELCFSGGDSMHESTTHSPFVTHAHVLHSDAGYESPRGSVGGGSQSGSVVSRGSDRLMF